MKNVILFGINKFQNKLEHILNDEFNVCGYSDFSLKYADIKSFEYKNFYKPEVLSDTKFDYIILCLPNKKESENTLISLREAGIDEDKIVQTYCLSWNERMFRTTFDDFISLNKNFEGLVFGMSYSRFAFLTHFFDKDFFKFSLGGVDLYTNRKWLDYLLKNHRVLLASVKYVVLDLPYYIFNWDITSTSQIFYRMAYFDKFDDYRGFGEIPAGQKYIKNHKLLKSMFAEKFEANKTVYSNNSLETGEMLKKAKDDTYFEASGIWYKMHEKTIQENIVIFREFIDLIKQINPDIKIAAVTYPYAQKFMEINKEYINNLQKDFYNVIKSSPNCKDIFVFDFITDKKYKFDDTCFRDATHFNGRGAELFSKILNKKFTAQFY